MEQHRSEMHFRFRCYRTPVNRADIDGMLRKADVLLCMTAVLVA